MKSIISKLIMLLERLFGQVKQVTKPASIVS